MTTVPTCPTHHSPMKLGKGGGYFCPRKMDDESWCPERVAAPKAANGPAAATTSVGAPTPRQLLVIAALDFASRVYQGTADPEGSLSLANEVMAQFGGGK